MIRILAVSKERVSVCKEESIKTGFSPNDKTVHTAATRTAVVRGMLCPPRVCALRTSSLRTFRSAQRNIIVFFPNRIEFVNQRSVSAFFQTLVRNFLKVLFIISSRHKIT